jgi:hypothetical protein
MSKPTLKIRGRERRGYSPEVHGYSVWFEYQVVEGNRVVFRGETRAEAEDYISNRLASLDAPKDGGSS